MRTAWKTVVVDWTTLWFPGPSWTARQTDFAFCEWNVQDKIKRKSFLQCKRKNSEKSSWSLQSDLSSLFQRLCWHQNKSRVLVLGPYTKMQPMFWCQHNLRNKLLGHHVQNSELRVVPKKVKAALPVVPIAPAAAPTPATRRPPVEPLGLPGGVRVEVLVQDQVVLGAANRLDLRILVLIHL